MINMNKLKIQIQFASHGDARAWADEYGGRIFQHDDTEQVLWYSHPFTLFEIMVDLLTYKTSQVEIGWKTFTWKGFKMTDSISGL